MNSKKNKNKTIKRNSNKNIKEDAIGQEPRLHQLRGQRQQRPHHQRHRQQAGHQAHLEKRIP